MDSNKILQQHQVLVQYAAARKAGDAEAGDALIRRVIQQTRMHTPDFSLGLEILINEVGIKSIFDMAETWRDLTAKIGSSRTARPKTITERIRLEPIPYIVIPAVAATVGLLAGGIAFRDVKIIEVPSQQVSIDSPYAIKRSPSGRTAYQIFDPYQKTGKELSKVDLTDYLSLVGGRLSPKISPDGVYLTIWNPNLDERTTQLYKEIRGNDGRHLVPSTTLADGINPIVLDDKDIIIQEIVADFVLKNYQTKINPNDIILQRSGGRISDILYSPKGIPTQTNFSTESGHILFREGQVLYVPNKAMRLSQKSSLNPNSLERISKFAARVYGQDNGIPTHNVRQVAKLPDYGRAKQYQARMRG